MAGKQKNKKAKRKSDSSHVGGKLMLDRVSTLLRGERVEEALALSAQVIAKQPSWAKAYAVRGEVFQAAGKGPEAVSAFEQSLALEPDVALVHYRLAIVLFELGHTKGAANHFQRTTELQPERVAAYRNLAVALNQRGEYVDAVSACLHAYQLDSNNIQTRQSLAVLLAKTSVYNHPNLAAYDTTLSRLVCDLLGDPELSFQGLAPLAASQVMARYDQSEVVLETLADDSLLLVLLSTVINVNFKLEHLLTQSRRNLLRRFKEGELFEDKLLSLVSALAVQCFVNEYLWVVEDWETQAVDALEKRLQLDPAGGLLAVYAMYRPAYKLANGEFLSKKEWPAELSTVLLRTLVEPLAERVLVREIQVLSPIQNTTSLAVRNQYEANPFPRWMNLIRGGKSLSECFRLHCPAQPVPAHLRSISNILVAGCGTGQHPIAVAMANPGAQVLAIDLSLASLSYARRKANELGVKNIRFAQADILCLNPCSEPFQHIECMGVLHHMAVPLDGWRVLRSLLTPTGTMRIGLYSERARAGVVAAREIIAREDLKGELQSMRNFRFRILTERDLRPLRDALLGLDFFSTSTLRDLIFHVSEQRYSPERLHAELKLLKLNFLGFELRHLGAFAEYGQEFPDDSLRVDLTNWDLFEQAHPATFKAMYNFWVGAC